MGIYIVMIQGMRNSRMMIQLFFTKTFLLCLLNLTRRQGSLFTKISKSRLVSSEVDLQNFHIQKVNANYIERSAKLFIQDFINFFVTNSAS